jgi:hypothetical protein
VFASNVIGPGFRGSNLGGGSNVVVEPSCFSSNLTVAGTLTATSSTYIAGSLSASNMVMNGRLTASNVDLTGALMFNGTQLTQVSKSSQMNEYAAYGTESVTIAGGNLVIDTASTLSAIIELAAGSEPLSIALIPSASFAPSQVGKSGNIVIVERSTTGRSFTLDPRIHFATNYNLTSSGFNNTSLNSTTLSGLTTTPAPALGGFAVDSIDYYIPKTGFAIGNYYRQFKCMPPAFDEAGLTGVTHTGYTNAVAYTLNVASFLIPTYNEFYGPLSYSISPSSVASVSISGISGILTINKNTALTGSLVVSIQGITGTVTRTLAFDIKPWFAPFILDAAPGLPDYQNTNLAGYTLPAPIMEHGPEYTGAITWSLSPAIAGATLNVATGQLTFPQGTTYSGAVTLTSTGAAPSSYTTSASVTLNVVNWVTPSIDPIASQVGTTAAAPYVITPVTAGNDYGTLVWSLSPSSLLSTSGVTFDPATGTLTVALHTALNVANVTVTATGPTGLSASRAFAISVTPWADPKFTTDYVTDSHDTITGTYVLAGPSVQQASSLIGTLTWSVAPSSLASILDTATGALTFPLHYSFPTQDVTLTATGPSGETESDTFSLTIVPYATPVVASISDAAVYTGPGAFSLAAPTQTAANTGAVTWSLGGTPPAGVSIDASTGVITVSHSSVFVATSITVKATGPVMTIYGTTSFQLSAVLWAAPVVATIGDQTINTTLTPNSTVTPTLSVSSYIGTLAWSVLPASLDSLLNKTNGVLSFPLHYYFATTNVTLTATGPSGLTSAKTFALNVVPYATPAIATISDTIAYTGSGIFALTAPSQTTANTGAITWSLSGTPAGVSINASTGVISVSQSTVFVATSLTVKATGPEATIYSTRSFNLTAALWATPTITAIAEQILDSTSVDVYVTPALVSAAYAGTITWSVSTTGSTALSSYISTTTGKLTFPTTTVVAIESVTIRGTGPTGLYGEATFYLTVNVVVVSRFPSYDLTVLSDANYDVTASSDVSSYLMLFKTSTGSGGISLTAYSSTTGIYTGGATTIYFNGATNVTVAGAWVQLKSTVAHRLSKYVLKEGGFDAMPTAWVVVASNDGTSWTLVDSRSGQSFQTWGSATYTLTAISAPYLYYRILLTMSAKSSCRPYHVTYYGL